MDIENSKIQDDIFDYINNRFTQKKKDEFESKMKNHPELEEEVLFQRMMFHNLKDYKAHLLSPIDSALLKIDNKTKIIYLIKKNRFKLSVAASVLLFVSVFFLKSFFYKNNELVSLENKITTHHPEIKEYAAKSETYKELIPQNSADRNYSKKNDDLLKQADNKAQKQIAKTKSNRKNKNLSMSPSHQEKILAINKLNNLADEELNNLITNSKTQNNSKQNNDTEMVFGAGQKAGYDIEKDYNNAIHSLKTKKYTEFNTAISKIKNNWSDTQKQEWQNDIITLEVIYHINNNNYKIANDLVKKSDIKNKQKYLNYLNRIIKQ